MDRLGIGIIGCGHISATYLKLAPKFRHLELRAVADIDHAAAAARAAKHNVRAESVDSLLASPDIDLVINLTVPAAHFEVTKAILESGKHAYSEKPVALRMDECRELAGIAAEAGLRVGAAPDTWLGGSHQAARREIDSGAFGRIIAGAAHVLSRGMEHWHPNPDFFYLPGGGPVLDLGPYYVANLVQLLGPVDKVAALATAPRNSRLISSGPRKGERIPVETPTNIHALLHFRSGATVDFSASWDVWAHRQPLMELYGEEGAIFLPDPNFFGGEVESALRGGDPEPMDCGGHPFGRPNRPDGRANYRAAGCAEMAQAIIENRPHRCSLELAAHSLDIMTGILRSGETGQFVEMDSDCARPEPLTAEQAESLLK